MNNLTVGNSIIKVITDYYAEIHEEAFAEGKSLHDSNLPYLSDDQRELLAAARERCEAALKESRRHFTGGLSCFKPT